MCSSCTVLVDFLVISQFITLPSLLIQCFVPICYKYLYCNIIYLVYMSVFPIRLQAPLGRGPCLIHLFISSDYHKAWLIVGTKMFVGWINEWMHIWISNNGVTITSLVNSYQFFKISPEALLSHLDHFAKKLQQLGIAPLGLQMLMEKYTGSLWNFHKLSH